MAISKLVEEAVREKSKRMISNSEWVKYGQTFEGDKAFLAGAIDAMIFDVGAVLNPRDIPSHEERKALILSIIR